jgi:hypothetical protein
MNKIICTGSSGSHKKFAEMSLPLMQKYADKHDWGLYHHDFDDSPESEGRPGAWGKIKVIKRMLEEHDYVLWLDIDIAILRSDKDILEDFPPEYYSFGLVKHEVEASEVPNTGVWLIKSNDYTIEMMDKIWDCPPNVIRHPWWEQASFMRLMGYDLFNTRTRLTNPTPVLHHTIFLPLEWNCHPKCSTENPRFNHWTIGPNMFRWRLDNMRKDIEDNSDLFERQENEP